MNLIRGILFLSLTSLAFGRGVAQVQGPFGLSRGMTEAQVIQLIGEASVVRSGSLTGFPTLGTDN